MFERQLNISVLRRSLRGCVAGQEGAHFWKLSWVEMELLFGHFLGWK